MTEEEVVRMERERVGIERGVKDRVEGFEIRKREKRAVRM